MLYLSILLKITSIYLFKDKLNTHIVSAIVTFLVLISFFGSGFYYLSDYLTGNGVDESVFFHLTTDLRGVALQDFSKIIAITSCYIVFILIISFFTYKFVYSKKETSANKLKLSTLATTFLILSLFINPGIQGLTDLYKISTTPSAANITYPEEYISPEVVGLDKKNLVYIYLESLERTYLDESLFPNLTPNLNELEKNSLAFTDIKQVYGSNWTIAGMVSSQCGVPLVNPGNAGSNDMSGVLSFLPRAVCVGDILKSYDYNLNYLGGSSLDFAGKGRFYETHGFTHVKGLNELKDGLENPEYINPWGLYDDSLFEIVKTRYDELSNNPEPFGLFTLTVDTHHPKGHTSEYCSKFKYADGSNPILNSVHCADHMTAELINHIRSSDSYKDTLVIIASDHLAMKNTAYKTLEQGKRRNLLMFLGQDIEPQLIHTTGSTIDIAPMLLSLLGADIDEFGFGRNLLKDQNSFTESENNVDAFLKSHRDFFSSLWAFQKVIEKPQSD